MSKKRKNPAAVALGKLGAAANIKAKGWLKMSPSQRTARARKAGLARAIKAGQTIAKIN